MGYSLQGHKESNTTEHASTLRYHQTAIKNDLENSRSSCNASLFTHTCPYSLILMTEYLVYLVGTQ